MSVDRNRNMGTDIGDGMGTVDSKVVSIDAAAVEEVAGVDCVPDLSAISGFAPARTIDGEPSIAERAVTASSPSTGGKLQP